MNSGTVKLLIIVVGIAIIGAAGYLIHHLMTGKMPM